MIKNYLLFGILVIMLVFAMTAVGCDYNPIDDNNNGDDTGGGGQKNAILLSSDTWADGSLTSTSGEQWFKFTATASTQYVHVMFGTITRLYIQLYNSKNNSLGDAIQLGGYWSSNGEKANTSLTVTSGQEYYVKVTPYSSSGSGTYRIGFNTMPLAPGLLAGATTLTAGTWANGIFTEMNREQWFKFTATANTQYVHTLFGSMTRLYVRLYDNNGSTLGEAIQLGGYWSSNGEKANTSLSITNGQVYYLQVTPYSDSGTGTYQIGFNTMPLAPGILESATTLTANTWADGIFTEMNREQWFKFTATASTQYIHTLFGSMTRLYVRLYGSNGSTLGDSIQLGGYWSADGEKANTSLSITNGQVYYLQVTPYSDSGTGTYKIAFNTSTTSP